MIPYLRKKKLKHILYHIVLIIGILAIFISVGPLLIIGHFGKPGGVALMFSGMWAMISFLPALLILVVGIIISLNGILKSLPFIFSIYINNNSRCCLNYCEK